MSGSGQGAASAAAKAAPGLWGGVNRTANGGAAARTMPWVAAGDDAAEVRVGRGFVVTEADRRSECPDE